MHSPLSIYFGIALSFIILGLACPFSRFLRTTLCNKNITGIDLKIFKVLYLPGFIGLTLGMPLLLPIFMPRSIQSFAPGPNFTSLWDGYSPILLMLASFVLWSLILILSFRSSRYFTKGIMKKYFRGAPNPIGCLVVILSLASIGAMWTSRPNLVFLSGIPLFLGFIGLFYSLVLIDKINTCSVWREGFAFFIACTLVICGPIWVCQSFS